MWVGTEKVHGANGGLWTDGIEVKISKKSQFVGESENFYKANEIRARYEEGILFIHKALKTYSPEIESICVCGEIFGGMYPHPDVKKAPNASKVQKGIYYIPHNDFIVFDIITTDIDGNEKFLDWGTVRQVVSHTELKTVPELIVGTFEEVMNYTNEGQSEVHKLYGLPTIEDNIMEGVVAKPIETGFLFDGSRVIVKNKNDKWSEKAHAPKRIRDNAEVNEAIKPIVDEISKYVTENRLRNVLSHIGPVTNKDFGLINKEFVGDIMKDYMIENGNSELSTLEKSDKKLVSKSINRQTTTIIRSNFLNIIDGEF
jgi:Rnl2 family RNA ligase